MDVDCLLFPGVLIVDPVIHRVIHPDQSKFDAVLFDSVEGFQVDTDCTYFV
jgi:hypothetical protein